MEPTKPDFVTKAGVEIVFDLDRITIKEYRTLFEDRQTDEAGDAIIAKCTGLTVDQVQSLGQNEWRRLVKAFFAKAREPLSDPL
jgi:hypothetical protein